MSIEEDARAFGQHFKQGGWRLGLLVARNVEHGGTGGRPQGNRSPENGSAKVSMTKFAEMADVSKSHVSYYFNAWQLAAEGGHCPHAENLSPDDDEALDHIDQDDEHTRELWLTYYRKARDDGHGGDETPGANQPGSKSGTGSKATKNGSVNKTAQAVESLAKTSERISKTVVQVLSSPPVRGEDAEIAEYAEELRRIRSVFDGYCQEIDRVLDRIGFGDDEAAATTELTSDLKELAQ